MVAGSVVSALLSIVVGTTFGCFVRDNWLPFVKLVHIFCAYWSIYSTVNSNLLEAQKRKRFSSLWVKFSVVRDFMLISSFRGVVNETVESYVKSQCDSLNLQAVLMKNGGYLQEGAASLLVCFAFEEFLSTRLGNYVISSASVFIRALRSVEILKSFKNTSSMATLIEMGKLNVLNSSATTITMTITDLVFRGDLSILSQWIGVRLVYFLTPYLQSQLGELGLPKLHAQLVSQARVTTHGYGLQFAERLEDVEFVATLFLFFVSAFVFTPAAKSVVSRLLCSGH